MFEQRPFSLTALVDTAMSMIRPRARHKGLDLTFELDPELSSLESEAVKRRHLPTILRPISGLWQRPIRWASAIAAGRVNAAARKL